MFFILPRTIRTTAYLTEEQKDALERALEEDGANSEEGVSLIRILPNASQVEQPSIAILLLASGRLSPTRTTSLAHLYTVLLWRKWVLARFVLIADELRVGFA